ncbi:hypothetical protein ACW6QP_13625 [Salegentibacter sp. HM20]
MKNILLIILMFAGFSFQALAQDTDKQKQREKIKALKVAFITQELNLSNKTAQQFWPIYNAYEEKKRELHRREHIDLGSIECINEREANEMLAEYVQVEREEYIIKKQLFEDLRKIISAQDIIKLHKLEDEFHKKLIREYRARKENDNRNNEEEE